MLKTLVRSKIAIFSTVLAVVLATTSVTSVFAASATAPNLTNHNMAVIWGNQFRELQADRAIYNNFKSHAAEIRNSSKPAESQQYLAQYAFALGQAEAIVLHGSPSSTSTVKVNNRYERSLTAQQELGMYLHMIRGLREKLRG